MAALEALSCPVTAPAELEPDPFALRFHFVILSGPVYFEKIEMEAVVERPGL